LAKGDDIEERLIDFAVRIINLCSNLPKTQAGKHLAGQLLRSGTAPAAHYAEARSAESSKDFIHKLKICLKELNESRVWLKIIAKSKLLPATRLQDIATEADELCRIINASIKTARK
jgi:four helix bundle protein